MRNPRNKKRGAILAEALLTIIILSIGLTAIVQSYLSSYRASVLTQDYVIASTLLKNKMDELLQMGSIKTGETDDGDFPDPFSRFHYHWESHALPAENKFNDVNQVTVDVSWAAGSKQNRMEAVTFLLNTTQ